MRRKGIEKSQALDSVRLQRLIDVCHIKENTALYLLEEWNYEPQVRSRFLLAPKLGRLETRIAILGRKSVLLTSRFNYNKSTSLIL